MTRGRPSTLRRYGSLYRSFLRLHFRKLAEYPSDFWVGMTATILTQIGGLLFVWVVFGQVRELAGWSVYEVIMLYALAVASGSIARMFTSNVWTLGATFIRQGDLIRLLLRPFDPLFHLLAERFEQEALGGIVLAAMLIAGSMTALGMAGDVWRWLLIIPTVLLGAIIVAGINLAIASLSFWMVDSAPLMWAFSNFGGFARYPLVIYGSGIRCILTWILPYALTTYYPAMFILGRGTWTTWLATPIGAVAVVAVALWVWKTGLRRFEGVGS